MFSIWETVKVCILGSVLITAIAITWEVQQWRWESKQTEALEEQTQRMAKEAKKESNAATVYEQKREATDETYKAIDKAIHSNKSPSIVCFDTKRLRIVNHALSRTAPRTTGPSRTLPQS